MQRKGQKYKEDKIRVKRFKVTFKRRSPNANECLFGHSKINGAQCLKIVVTQWLNMAHPMVDQCSPNDCDPMSPIFETDFQTAAYKDLNVSVPVRTRRGNMPASKPRSPIVTPIS